MKNLLRAPPVFYKIWIERNNFWKQIRSVLEYSESDSYERSNSILSAKDKRFIFAHPCDNKVLSIFL